MGQHRPLWLPSPPCAVLCRARAGCYLGATRWPRFVGARRGTGKAPASMAGAPFVTYVSHRFMQSAK